MTWDLMNRRTVLTGALGLLAGAMVEPRAASAQAAPWSSGVDRPRTAVPALATDCHHHIYESRYPVDPRSALRPADATVADYRRLQQRIGVMRHVIVQPSTYGTNNLDVIESLAAFGSEARGIAVVDTSVTDSMLADMDKAGIRGIRFIMSVPGGVPLEMLEPLSARVNELGWHVQIVMGGDDIVHHEALLNRLASPLVFDHMGQIPQPAGTSHPAFGVLSRLLETGKTWVKLSGAYTFSKIGAPSYADATTLAQAFVRLAPERMVWGSDWPHPTEKTTKPDDALLFDLLALWAPDEAIRQKILVSNPEALYGFGKTRSG